MFIGETKSFHSFVDWGKEYVPLSERDIKRRFLPGSFIVERGEKRQRELLETPEGMVARMNRQALEVATKNVRPA